MNRLKISIFALACSAAFSACGASTQVPNTANIASNTAANALSTPQAAAPPAVPANTDKAAISGGKELYATNCQICHKDDGKGGKVTVEGKNLKVDDLTTEKMQKRDDAKLAKQILEGVPDEGMPSFQGKLTDDEVRLIVQHIRSLQKPL